MRRKLATRISRACVLVVLVTIAVSAIAAAWVAPHDPFEQVVSRRLLPPFQTREFLLGTDYLGRDTLSRLILGARYSLAIGFLTMVLSTVIGVVIGLVGAYFKGVADALSNALISARLAFPLILLVLILVAVLGPGLQTTIIALSSTLWVRHAVVVRNQVQVLREREFVEAARGLGAGHFRILVRHVLPSTLPQILVLSTLTFSEAVLAESFLSFLGLGVQLPTPTWGNMIAEGRLYALTMWWLAAFPGAAILVTTLSVNYLGESAGEVRG